MEDHKSRNQGTLKFGVDGPETKHRTQSWVGKKGGRFGRSCVRGEYKQNTFYEFLRRLKYEKNKKMSK